MVIDRILDRLCGGIDVNFDYRVEVMPRSRTAR
jgi:hypothetical protein